MKTFAQIKNNVVINTILADTEFINSLLNKDDYKVLTRGGIGWTYDGTNDVFIAPKPYPSWLLDGSQDWIAPVAYPLDGKIYVWDEVSLNWIIQN